MKALKYLKIVLLLVFLSLSGMSFSQEPMLTDTVKDKVAIGFPDLTIAQLTQIQNVFANHDHIASARYVFGGYNEMVIFFNTSQPHFKTYYDVLKIISPFYDVKKCYLDDQESCAILNNITTETFFQVK